MHQSTEEWYMWKFLILLPPIAFLILILILKLVVWESVSIKQLLLRGHILLMVKIFLLPNHFFVFTYSYATTMHSSVYGGAIYSRTAFIFKSIGISHPYSGFHQCPIYFELEPKNSIPFQVLTCEHGTPNSELGFVKQVYPVELLHFPLVTTGQGHGIVPRSSYSIFQQNKWKYVISSIPKYSKSGGKLHRAFLPSAFIKCKPQWDISALCRWPMLNWWTTSELISPTSELISPYSSFPIHLGLVWILLRRSVGVNRGFRSTPPDVTSQKEQ